MGSGSVKCGRPAKKRVTPIFDRLERFQVKSDGCWAWSGSKDGKGYGILSSRHGNSRSPEKAHRVSYEKENGEIPDGMVVRHKCDNPECTNPDHLEVGTQKDNMRDMVNRGRMNEKSIKNLNHEKALTKSQVSEIKKMKFVGANGRGEGVTRKEVAKLYGVCVDIINAIVKGKYHGK